MYFRIWASKVHDTAKAGPKSHGYAYVDALPLRQIEVSNVAATKSDFFLAILSLM